MATRSDTFDRADSSSLGSDWTEDSGNWAINTNNIRNDSSGSQYYKLRWTGAAMDSNNYYVEMPARSGSSSIGIGPAARLAGSATVSYYAFLIFGGDSAYLVYINGGAETILDTGSAITASTNYTLRIQVDGTTIRGYLNGVLDCEATHSTLTSGAPGIGAYGGGNSNTYGTQWTAVDLASGTTYNQSAAGSVAPSGALVRSARKTLAGAVGLAGSLVRSARKILAGSVAPSGSTVRSTSKTLAGVLGLAGALASVRTILASLTGTLNFSAVVTRGTAKTLVGAVGLAGSTIRSTLKTLSGSVGLAGTLAADFVAGLILVSVSGALGLAGTVTRSTSKTLAGVLGLAGSATRRTSKALTGALSFIGSLVSGNPATKVDATYLDVSPFAVALVQAAPFAVALTDSTPIEASIGDDA